jgi:hypothetical protein
MHDEMLALHAGFDADPLAAAMRSRIRVAP